MLAVQSMMTLSAGSWMLAKWYVKESKFASVSCGTIVPPWLLMLSSLRYRVFRDEKPVMRGV